jgi:hypothetical protein
MVFTGHVLFMAAYHHVDSFPGVLLAEWIGGPEED